MRARLVLALGVLAACDKPKPPTPVAPPPPPVVVAEAPEARAFARPRLGDRAFVEAVLTDVFGPSIAPDLHAAIHSNPAIFGGPCNLYEQVYVEDGGARAALVDEAAECAGGMPALSYPLVGSSSTLRAGWLAKACVRATSNPAAMQYAVAKLSPAGPPTLASVTAAYRRFFPGRQPPAAVVEALLGVTPTATADERWKQIHMALCLTPDWQIP